MNLHPLRDQILSLARLPVPPSALIDQRFLGDHSEAIAGAQQAPRASEFLKRCLDHLSVSARAERPRTSGPNPRKLILNSLVVTLELTEQFKCHYFFPKSSKHSPSYGQNVCCTIEKIVTHPRLERGTPALKGLCSTG